MNMEALEKWLGLIDRQLVIQRSGLSAPTLSRLANGRSCQYRTIITAYAAVVAILKEAQEELEG